MCDSSNLRGRERNALPVFMLPGKGLLYADRPRAAICSLLSRYYFTLKKHRRMLSVFCRCSSWSQSHQILVFPSCPLFFTLKYVSWELPDVSYSTAAMSKDWPSPWHLNLTLPLDFCARRSLENRVTSSWWSCTWEVLDKPTSPPCDLSVRSRKGQSLGEQSSSKKQHTRMHAKKVKDFKDTGGRLTKQMTAWPDSPSCKLQDHDGYS